MPITQILLTAASQGGGGGFTGDGSPMTAGNPFTGVSYTITPSTNGIGSPGTAYPGNIITWDITSQPSESGKTIIWWVDNNALPVTNWVGNPNYNGNQNAGSVVLDGNGSASVSLEVVGNPTFGTFRLYFSETLYQGWITHGYIAINSPPP
jgi:hypothetical protein